MLPLILALAAAEPSEVQTIRIPVARHDLHPGHRIDDGDLRMITYLPDLVPSIAIRHDEQAIGRVVREPVYEGEVLRPERLSDHAAAAGLGAIVPRGMQILRLVPTLPSPAVAPSSYVDVLHGERFCVAGSAIHVLGVETPDGEIHTHGNPLKQTAWHLAVTPAQTKQLLALPSYTLALRNEIDVSDVPGLACDAPAAADAEP